MTTYTINTKTMPSFDATEIEICGYTYDRNILADYLSEKGITFDHLLENADYLIEELEDFRNSKF